MDVSMLPPLEPCPFCGLQSRWRADVHKGSVYVSIECSPACYGHSVIAYPLERASALADLYNTRKRRFQVKALTISQPFASLIVDGKKWIENRTWAAGYRGPLAIHAGKGSQYLSSEELGQFPCGCIIGVCRLVACVAKSRIEMLAPSSKRLDLIEDSRRSWGEANEHEHCEGPWCWILDNVKRVEPVYVRGLQGLWNFDGELKVIE